MVLMTGSGGAREFYDSMAKEGLPDWIIGESIHVDVADEGKQTIWRSLSSLTVVKTPKVDED